MASYFVVTLPLMASGQPVPTLLPKGGGEGEGEGETHLFQHLRSLCDSI